MGPRVRGDDSNWLRGNVDAVEHRRSAPPPAVAGRRPGRSVLASLQQLADQLAGIGQPTRMDDAEQRHLGRLDRKRRGMDLGKPLEEQLP